MNLFEFDELLRARVIPAMVRNARESQRMRSPLLAYLTRESMPATTVTERYDALKTSTKKKATKPSNVLKRGGKR